MLANMKCMFVSSDWAGGTVTATIVATVNDYFGELPLAPRAGIIQMTQACGGIRTLPMWLRCRCYWEWIWKWEVLLPTQATWRFS
jgi:hypothetical protein